jgi:pimeloyl-ACP methyl ester carboxylesterase
MGWYLKYFRQMLMLVVVFGAGLFAIGAGLLVFRSNGKPKPFLDSQGKPLAGSISEKNFLTLGGISQGMFIKGKNYTNPVLLYLHGGIPDYFLTQKYPTGLEDYFTVVWWEQRGSGLSFHADMHADTITLDQLLADARELTEYLRRRFGQEKIYLMGRSGGSYIGIQLTEQAPELYHAYIGVGQMSDQRKSEKQAYEFMLKYYQETNNKRMLRKLVAAPVTDSIPDSYLQMRDEAMHSLGIGTTHDMKSVPVGMFLPSLLCEEYTLSEKLNLWRGKSRSGVHPLWNKMITTDLAQQVKQLKIPIYFFHGRYDYTVSYPLAKRYFETLHAPVKGFYTFENAAHSPHLEEPTRIKEIMMNDVLQRKVSLADR